MNEYIDELAAVLELHTAHIIENQRHINEQSSSQDAHAMLVVGIKSAFILEREINEFQVPTIRALRAKRQLREAINSSTALLKQYGI